MSKYIKLSSIILFIAITLTGFGLYKSQASGKQPELKIVTSQGKPELIEPVQAYGFLSHYSAGNYPSTLKLNNGSLSYLEDESFFKQLDSNINPFTDHLISNYRSFMRGKSRQANQFAETDQYILYAGLQSDVFFEGGNQNEVTLAALNKETEEEETFSVQLENDSSYNEIRAIYVDYPSVTLLVRTHSRSDKLNNVVYTFDVENPEDRLTEEVNLTREIGSDDSLYIGKPFDQTERYITLQTARENMDSMYTYTEEVTGYYAYDIKEKEVISIPSTEENMRLFTDNDKLYVGKVAKDNMGIYELKDDNQNMTLLGKFELSPSDTSNDALGYNHFNQNMTILNGKLYTYEYPEDMNRPLFKVTDIRTQEILFSGTIEQKDSNNEESPFIDIIEYRLNPMAN